MKRSIVLLAVAAAFGLTACTSTPTPDATPTTTTSDPTTAATVVTEVVTATVTKEAPPPAKPVMDSFGYGPLKLGMTLQQALDTKLIGPAKPGNPADLCTLHDLLGTGQSVYVSKKIGVANIYFTAAMTSDGVGVGGTEAALKAKYSNLVERHGGDSWTVPAPGNPTAWFDFSGNPQDTLDGALLRHVDQDCHS
ncbi:hypothetical protein [Lentzea sp. NBRC 102530]|uniref:hypothetical protein n=1 Tax=Lentzea sp. NBRC 102530 TaxID=3032201 RepID=UPI0024A0EAB3|nr:hypothetical protein [Lentzea sp. NBRC 102530]GLY48128.1 hypothetical protein Lesp01_17840 [Lentzea sp. NBRC 102530]